MAAKHYVYLNTVKQSMSIKLRGIVIEHTKSKKLINVLFDTVNDGAIIKAGDIADRKLNDSHDQDIVEVVDFPNGKWYVLGTGEQVLGAKEAVIIGTKVFCHEGDLSYPEKQLTLEV